MLGTVADVHALHHLGDASLAFRRRNVKIAQRQLDVLIHIEFVNKVEALEHEADISFAELGTLLLLEVSHLGTQKFIGTAGRIVQQAKDIEQCRLAATRRSHDGDELAVLDFKRYAVQSRGLNLFRTEDFGKVGNFNHNELLFNYLFIL